MSFMSVAKILLPIYYFRKKRFTSSTEDATLPSIVPGKQNDSLMGAMVLINNSAKTLQGLQIETNVEGENCDQYSRNTSHVYPKSNLSFQRSAKVGQKESMIVAYGSLKKESWLMKKSQC